MYFPGFYLRPENKQKVRFLQQQQFIIIVRLVRASLRADMAVI